MITVMFQGAYWISSFRISVSPPLPPPSPTFNVHFLCWYGLDSLTGTDKAKGRTKFHSLFGLWFLWLDAPPNATTPTETTRYFLCGAITCVFYLPPFFFMWDQYPPQYFISDTFGFTILILLWWADLHEYSNVSHILIHWHLLHMVSIAYSNVPYLLVPCHHLHKISVVMGRSSFFFISF